MVNSRISNLYIIILAEQAEKFFKAYKYVNNGLKIKMHILLLKSVVKVYFARTHKK